MSSVARRIIRRDGRSGVSMSTAAPRLALWPLGIPVAVGEFFAEFLKV